MKKYMIKVDGVMHEVEVDEVGGASTNIAPIMQSAPVASAAPAKASAGANTVTAPLQGNVQTVKVNVGDKVNAGDVVVIIEAMKMENEVPSTVSGTVKAIHVQKGTKVSAGDALLDIA